MNFITRKWYPVVRESKQTVRSDGSVLAEGGLRQYDGKSVLFTESGTYKVDGLDVEYSLLDELKKCCLFGSHGVYAAFSNISISFFVPSRIGRISRVDFDEVLPEGFLGQDLVIIAHPLCVCISGDAQKGEVVFPHFQYTGENKINITSSAFDRCPSDYSPTIPFTAYLSFPPEDQAVKLLHKSIDEFSKNRASFAIIYLFAAIESAVTILSGRDDGRVSSRMLTVINKLDRCSSDIANVLRPLKKKIENRIVARRGDFAHLGKELNQNDLLPCYETALEFFWYYSDMKESLGIAEI